ncbi:hypothetical protein K445DRAFT_319858 [Daldinia sp. EC12]|nr:hypothetical protein K445DRAFT_319858 [Daldinia sp. EC12]
MAKGWIKKLNRAWSSNAEMHSHLSRFKEIHPGWDPKDSDRLAQIGDIVDRGVFSVLQDMRELVNDRPDPLDEEYVYVNDFEPVNPFLTDDEAGSSDEESESSECKKGSSTNETTDGGASFDDAVDQLHISQLRITDSDSDSDSDWD